jgi:hypothetical protein
MLYNIIKIQQRFLLKKFLFELNKNKQMFNELNAFINNPLLIDKDKQFDLLKNLLLTKKYILNVDSILYYHYRLYGVHKEIAPKLNSRLFLIAWMLVSFPEYLMNITNINNNQKEQYPYDIYYITKDFIYYINLLCETTCNQETMRKF